MNKYSQKDKRWDSAKLGTCNDTIGNSGCFITCLGMIAEITPLEVNKILTKTTGYASGCRVVSDKACYLLGLDYAGRTSKDPKTLCIAETNHYAKYGVPQHFVVFDKGAMVDPLDTQPKSRICNYNIVSYRLISKPKSMEKTYYIKSQLRNLLKEVWEDFDHESGSSQKKMAEKLGDWLDADEEDLKVLNDKLNDMKKEIEENVEACQEKVIYKDVKTWGDWFEWFLNRISTNKLKK